MNTKYSLIYVPLKTAKEVKRGHTELNHGPLDLQSNALPLSYTPSCIRHGFKTSLHINTLEIDEKNFPQSNTLHLQKDARVHTKFNHGPFDLQLDTLSLSYIPSYKDFYINIRFALKYLGLNNSNQINFYLLHILLTDCQMKIFITVR